LMERLGKIAGETKVFETELGGVGAFPALSRPRVLFVPVLRGQESFKGLAGGISRAVEDLGIAPESKEYHAHVTLGRVKEDTDARPILGFLTDAMPPVMGAMRADRFVLFQSRLTQEGPVYTCLHEYALA